MAKEILITKEGLEELKAELDYLKVEKRDEIAEIRAKTFSDLEIEAFAHGAMCVSFSARCLLSSYMTGRDANRGDCAQSCRWSYSLM